MQLIRITSDEARMTEVLTKEFGEEIAKNMMRAVKCNGMSAYGRLMVRQSGKSYLLFRLTAGEDAENA